MKDNVQLTEQQVILLRKKELELLKIFISVCEKLNLNYFVVEGTLLGTVRHQGFIPWDDDIDVGMMRSDYEIFLKNAQALLPDGFFLQTHQTDPNYPNCYAKLRNSHTVFLETSCKNLKMNHGIYIDIFPFDYYPNGKVKGKYFDFQKLLISYRIREVFYVPNDYRLSAANLIRKGLSLLAKCRYKTVEDAIDHREKLIRSFSNTSRVINNGSPWKNRERFNVKWLSKVTPLSFEGITVNVPVAYDKCLKHLYGDYMTLPPLNERAPHHYISAIDFHSGLD